jgi:hypothetical protein
MSDAIKQFLEKKFRPDLIDKPLILDADGVILDFTSGFTSYMNDIHGIQAVTSEPMHFDFSDAFPDTPKVAKHIPAFLESDHFANVTVYEEPVHEHGVITVADILQFLHGKGVILHLVSSVATNTTVEQTRRDCLKREFGNIFDSVHVIGLGESKADVLKTLEPGFFVDDQLSMCKDGSLAGHLSLLKSQKYNAESCKDEMRVYGIERIKGLIDLPYFQ